MKIIRVQGAEFKAIKPNLKMLAYTVTLKGHICAYMEHKETGEIYSHYLNNQEATKFKLKLTK